MWTHLWRRLQSYRKTLGMKHSHSYPTKIVILIKSVILMKGVGADIWFCLDKIQNFCIVWAYLVHKFEHAFNKHGTWFHPHGFTKFQRCELNLENFLRLLCVHIHFVIPLVFESLRNQKWTVRTCQKWQFCHISTIGILIWCRNLRILTWEKVMRTNLSSNLPLADLVMASFFKAFSFSYWGTWKLTPDFFNRCSNLAWNSSLWSTSSNLKT